MKDKSFAKRVGAFSSATLLSRILGYARDSLVASYFGGGLQTDAFYAALKIPNLFRRFLGEGSLTAAFVPVFSETLHKDGEKEAAGLLNAIFSSLLVILTVITILGMIFAPQVTALVSYGFTRDPEKFQLTVQLTRLTFPFLIFISLAALVSAALNARGRFFIPALAPAGLSIAEIGFIVICASFFSSPIEGLAVSAIVGVAIHFLCQIPSLKAEGFKLSFVRPFKNPRVKTVVFLMIPTILGLCSDQVNSFVDQFCASFLADGSVTALYNSNRVMQLPLALFGVAISSVALPSLALSAAQKSQEDFKEILSFALRLANYVLIPAFIGLCVLGGPIVKLLFEHGKFTAANSQLTVMALLPYSFGLPAYAASKILASAFYAHKNTKTPVKISFISMGINVVLNILLMQKLQVAGLSLATAIAAWVQTILLFVLLRRNLGALRGRHITKSFVTATVAGGAMAGITWVLYFVALQSTPSLLRVFGAIVGGGVSYLGLSRLLNEQEYKAFLNIVLHRDIPHDRHNA